MLNYMVDTQNSNDFTAVCLKSLMAISRMAPPITSRIGSFKTSKNKNRTFNLDMPTPPADLTVVSLTHAHAAQLKFWIDGVNRQGGGSRGKRGAMTKQGRAQELREHLAGY